MLVIFCLILILALSFLYLFYILPRSLHLPKKIGAPFVPTRHSAMPDVIQALHLHNNSILFDVGCGDGRILSAVLKSEPAYRNLKGVGVEIDWLPSLLARWKTRKLNVEIRRENILNTELQSATHIYCYLLPKLLASLEPHIIASCRKGTRIVSCDFPFPNLKEIEKISLSHRPHQFAKELYAYEV